MFPRGPGGGRSAKGRPGRFEVRLIPWRVRRTKILATLGPSSVVEPIFSRLLARVDGVRVNFSHGSDEEHRRVLQSVRRFRERHQPNLAIVADLQGPKIRLGALTPPQITLVAGQEWRLTTGERPGDDRGASVSLPELTHAAHRGDPLLLGDGNVALQVERIESGALVTKVTSGGTVSGHAGVFLPRAHLRTAILGPKDLRDLNIALGEGVEYVALSFVRDGRDLRLARRAVDRHPKGGGVGLIAKVERAEALAHVDEILDGSDGLMVARGDLGIEVPLERLALEQKMLLARTRSTGKIGIVATQMLLSMVASPRPTRAEATDVANAVLDGADVLMLSEESAVGHYPVESVDWLARISGATEPYLVSTGVAGAGLPVGSNPNEEQAVAEAAVGLAADLGAAAIVTPTHSGKTARLISSRRLPTPIIALSAVAATRRRLSLVWGVEARACPEHLPLDELRKLAGRLSSGSAKQGRGGPLVLTAGYPVEGRPTNLVTVVEPLRPSRGRGRPARSLPRVRRPRGSS